MTNQRNCSNFLVDTRRLLATMLVVTWWFIFLGSQSLHAGSLTAAEQKGVDWLTAQVSGDGALVSEGGSIATPLQVREESALSLRKLGILPGALATIVAGDGDSNTEYVARRVLGSVATGRSASNDTAVLIATQNPEGGWGLAPGYQSDVLDTALALQALAVVNGPAAAASNGLGFLSRANLVDGGWGVTDRSSVYMTANVLLAASAWLPNLETAAAPIATNASVWLLSTRNAQQEFGDSLDNAIGLLALATQSGQSSALQALVSALSSVQLADGSWADDPYVTALALRSLWLAGQAPVMPTSGDVAGVVVAESNGAPLAGASITISENAGVTATSGTDGSFRLSALPASIYTLAVNRTGYQSKTLTVEVLAGQTTNVGLLPLSAISTTASLSGVVKNSNGQPLQNVSIAVGSKAVLTDDLGAYQLLGISTGTATVTATLSGFRTVSASVSFVAGTQYLFSPTMYPSSVTPPPASVQGSVVDADTRLPISAAKVTLNGSAQTSGPEGRFSYAGLAAGAYVLAVSADGYQAATLSLSIVAGVNDIGALPLQPKATTTVLHGYVVDPLGSSISDASVVVEGGPKTQSDESGAYQLDNVAGTQFTIDVSATGYIAQSFVFSVSEPGEYDQDFQLVPEQVSNITLGPLTVAPATGGANTKLSVSSSVVNGGSAEFSGILLLEVYDSSNNLIGSGPLTDAQGFSLGTVNLQPGESVGVIGRWNSGQFAPGAYQFEMRLVGPDSVSGANPLGDLIQNQYAPFTITPTTHFSGTVAADPPVIQAGLDQAVHFTGVVKNDGNILFEAQQVLLTVADVKTGAIAFTASVSVDSLETNAIATPDFGSWTPQSGGNFSLTIASADAKAGSIVGNLYVGNVANTAFTVNPDAVLAGTRVTHGNIHISGVDPGEATVSDPLAPLIRTAIQNAVSHNDELAHSWIDTNKCESCHVSTQALVSGELTRRLATYNVLNRRTIINNIAANERRDGTTHGGTNYDGSLTAGDYDTLSGGHRLAALAFWGLTAYHDLFEIRSSLKRAADWTANSQAVNGNWASDENKVWFDNDISMSMLNLSGLTRTLSLLEENAISTVPSYATELVESALPLSSRGYLTASADGNLYCTDRTGPAVNLLRPDGSLITKWTKLGTATISDPRGVIVRKDGQVWLSSSSGTLRLNSDGTTTKLSSDSMNTLAVDSQGTVWGTKTGDPRSIYKLDPVTAQASAWISNGPFAQANLGRIIPDADGSLYVTDVANGKIYQVMPDKTVSTVTEIVQGYKAIPQLLDILKDGDHWLVSSSVGVFRLTSDWIAHRITWSRADQMARMADGTAVYAMYQSPGIRRLVIADEDATASVVKYQHSIDIGEQWLRGKAVGSTENMHLAQKLWGLGEAYRYFSKVDASRASLPLSAMKSIAAQLRANQAADGGWGRNKTEASDALVTAQVGIALDYLNPSASDPAIRKAVAWLLSQQQPDGSWSSADKIMTTNVSTTTMVAIWLPMILDRLGAIDAQVSATFPVNVQPASFIPAPTKTTADGAGNVTANWSLTGVTNDGIDLGFDLTMTDLQLGEVRPVATDAHMTFNNSFNQETVTRPIDIPDVTATARVSLSVATDHPDYPANARAMVTTTLVNLDDVEIDGTLIVNVYDLSGAIVGGVTQRAVSVPADGILPVTDPFLIGTILPAKYTVKAILSDGGHVLAQGETTFNVLPDDPSASATSAVHTDKQVYNPSDHVQILSHVESIAANTVLENLSLQVNVYNGANVLQYTHSYPITQLLPGRTIDFTGIQALTNAAPGLYAVKQDLFNSGGTLFNHVETAYSVSSTSDTGFGLVGTIAAVPKSLPVGGTVTLNATATNQGNGALNDLPLTITIVNPDTGTVMQQFDQVSTLPVGGSVPFGPSWITRGTPDTIYYAVLTAKVGSGDSARTLTLAVDAFELTLKLDADVTLKATKSPLAALVLVDDNTSSSERAQINAALASLDYVGTITSASDAFALGTRSGAYQLYLLLATHATPDATTLRLLREAVHRGEGVLSANGVVELPETLAQITGLTASNALTVINAQSIDALSSAPGGVARVTLDPSLTSRIVSPEMAQTQAVLTGRLPNRPDQGALAEELAALGRVDIGYFGDDAGVNDSQLSLTSMGRLRESGGIDTDTVWRIRNSSDAPRTVTLASVSAGYSQALVIMSHTDSFIASPIVTGSADHRLVEATRTIQNAAALTSVFSDARVVDVGDNPGAIALWANHIGATDVLDWTGSQHMVHGAVHSNSDIRLAGAQNVIDGPVHYVTSFTNSGNQNTFTLVPRQVARQPLPTLLDLDEFKPGGSVAATVGAQYNDASAECASSQHGWQRNASQMPLASGVYWVPCDVHISGGNGTLSKVTIVSTGAMQIDGVKGVFQPSYQGLQFATSSLSAGALQLSGDATQIGGLVFAPNGTVKISGSSLSLQCSVIGNEIRFANAKTTIDARACPYATVQRRSPAITLNSFGEGWAAYAAFSWPDAISQYEAAAPGELTSLFGGVLSEVAVMQNALRAGTVVPLTASVNNNNDAFTGQLTLQVNDDSLFMPSLTNWALDFTQHNPFQTQSNVRLGSGTSTDISATVSTATPIVISPLTQTIATITHLPGESVNDLIGAVSAIAGPDAGVTAALMDLQAAQVTLAANDREGALGHLLDAAEALGQSTNAQADSLRTRIDWVIWAATH